MTVLHFTPFRRPLALLLLLLVAGTLAGCGGGSSSTATLPAAFSLSGQITTTPTRAVSRAPLPAGVTVNAYLWPNLTTLVATTTTDSNGRYTLTLPHSATGKAAVVVANQTTGNTTVRFSAIVAGLTGSSIADANLDPATTLDAELVLANVPASTTTTLSSSAIATIDTEFKNWSGISGVDLTVGGANLPATLGAGLKAGGPAATFAASDATIIASLKALTGSSDPNVANGRAAIQMVRSLIFGVVSNAQSEQTSLAAAYQSQQQTITNGVKGAAAFGTRLKFVSALLGANSAGVQPLGNLPPGTYTEAVDPSSGLGVLTRTGSSPDGKSWIVTSALNDATKGQVVTFTPAHAIPVFKADPTAGTLSLSVVNPSDTALSYTATLAATETGSTVTTLTLNATLKDAALTQPIVFAGTLTGVPATGAGVAGPYTSITFGGSLQSQFGQAQITNLAVQWATSSQSAQSLQKVTLDSLTVTTGFTPAASLTASKLEIDYDTAQQANSSQTLIKQVAFTSVELKASGYDLIASNFALGFVPAPNVTPPQELLSTAQGQISYTSPQLTVTGSVQGTWTNPSTATGTVAGFPLGTLHLIGSLTPQDTKVQYAADLTLAGSVSGTNGVGTLTVNSITLGTQSLSGTVTATYPSTNGQIDSSKVTYAAALTQKPTGVQIALSGPSNNLVGTIHAGGAGSAKIADIGPANTLGLPDLGNLTIIKYSDGTFESAASILP